MLVRTVLSLRSKALGQRLARTVARFYTVAPAFLRKFKLLITMFLNYITKTFRHALLLCSILALALPAVAQEAGTERVYVKDGATFSPGASDTQYFTVAIENAAEAYVAYQVSLLLPDGVTLASYDGAPDVYFSSHELYPKDNRNGTFYHSLTTKVVGKQVNIICAAISGSRPPLGRTGDLFSVGVNVSPYLKGGDVVITLKEVKLSNEKGTGPVYGATVSSPVETETQSSLTLTISEANKYSTCMLPFAVSPLPEGLEVYSCGETDGDLLILEAQQEIKPFTPYIVYAPHGFTGTFTGEIDPESHKEIATAGYLSGTAYGTEVNNSVANYVLQNQGEGPMFYKVGKTPFHIPSGKCWLTIPASLQGAPRFHFGNATGIENVNHTPDTDNIYDLHGRRTTTPKDGIYIIGNKKVAR